MSSLPSNITHLLFLDFEATCNQKEETIDRREIIEFPCLLVRVRDSVGNKVFEHIDTFHEYVRPVLHPRLTSFCVELTGISQSTVDAADPFPAVFQRFVAWLRRHDIKPQSSLFVADNRWDVDEMLKSQLALSNLSAPSDTVPFNKWLNVKTAYLRRKYGFINERYPYTNLTLMLEDLGLSFEGRSHSGIDDARNVMRLYKKLDELGCNTFAIASQH